MNRKDIKMHKKYKITFSDRYNGRVAKCRGVDSNGDVTLEFKNGRKVICHAAWLENV